ncbi:UNVERIFIED_CONTAM: hypothetical protein HDU68_005490 [Siphonaria sp. JEL0065]|nr:hypothetical protein HDU68_005490 [Siphonaria sp. JEL0065]
MPVSSSRTAIGSISASEPIKKVLEDDIIKTQSSLFRLLVTDRSRLSADWTFVHPIFCRLVNACERLDEAHEYLSDAAEKMKKKKAVRRRATNGNDGSGSGQWFGIGTENGDATPVAPGSASQPIPANTLQQQTQSTANSSASLPTLNQSRAGTPMDTLMDSDRLLTNLVKLCRRVLKLCDSFGLSYEAIVDTLLVFLRIFESFDTPIWKATGISQYSFRDIKQTVFDKLRGILNAISTCILIEVQYITISSQKLLDSYCMLYYRALAHANAMNLSIVLDILQTAARELKSTTSPYNGIDSSNHPYRPAKKPAHRILQAIQLMFHRNLFNLPRRNANNADPNNMDGPIPAIHPDIADPMEQMNPMQVEHDQEQNQEFDTLGGLLNSRTSLREGLMSFAPGSMNSETAEFIEEILDSNNDLEYQLNMSLKIEESSGNSAPSSSDRQREYEESVEIAKCIRWMKEVVRWQRAGRQMEPVKDLLRRSMARIDVLRGVQRRFGLYFMD